MRPSPIVPNVDFNADGVQHGHLRLPYSRDDSAWGSVRNVDPLATDRSEAIPDLALNDEGTALTSWNLFDGSAWNVWGNIFR